MRLINLVLVAAFAFSPITTPVIAKEDNPGKTNRSGPNQAQRERCPGGFFNRKTYVWDNRQKKCVEVERSSNLDVDTIFQEGRKLALEGRYQDAIQVLWLADEANDPRILNYLGFANRKLGRIEIGLSYYSQSMALDPTYKSVRSYYGEALLQTGDLAGAKAELVTLEELCVETVGCEAYEELDEAIRLYEQAI